MAYTIEKISKIIQAETVFADKGTKIEYLLTDSRSLVFPAQTLFFAIKTQRRNGADFIKELYDRGVRNFVVEEDFSNSQFNKGNFLIVTNVLAALQMLAAFHRRQFTMPVVGITGSNGKTIVKEWLFQLMSETHNIVRSPKSYNSQIGVPLSVFQISINHDLAIIEAGISQPGEMEKLQSIIQPTIGILTNIGEAHASNFSSLHQKLLEKAKLFKNAELVICKEEHQPAIQEALGETVNIFSWGKDNCQLQIISIKKEENKTTIQANHRDSEISIVIPFTDNASIENAITCWCFLLANKMPHEDILARMKKLQPVEMRLQLKKAINDCSLINDSYSNDFSSLQIALDFLQQQSGHQSAAVILSDLGEAEPTEENYERVALALAQHKIKRFVGIGPAMHAFQALFAIQIPEVFFYHSVEDFIHHFSFISFKNELILLKGARKFEFERIDQLFEKQVHQTVLEVNLAAMVHNLKAYQNYLKPTTRIMAMVKAFSYGSGSVEVASVLQHHKVDYLAVAYADEGVDLRKSGINMPIMVMNPEPATFQILVQYNLEPELFSFEIMKAFAAYLSTEGMQQFPIHIKLDTGMHRLGFEETDLTNLVQFLSSNKALIVKSVFSHLVGSEDSMHDDFTKQQAFVFEKACNEIEKKIGYSFIKHLSNTAGIFRHPGLQYDMVRLGIGLYGIDQVGESSLQLLPVATLRTTVAQVRNVPKGETIGYSRKGVMDRDGKVATLRIGYADGFSRRLGNGVGHVWLQGKMAPVIGNVCMDMVMVDVSDFEAVQEGEMVEIFGANISVQKMAEWCQTIPYEIMTGISQRVKRVYYQE